MTETPDEFTGAVDELAGGRYLEAFGSKFEVADRIALMPLLRFAHLSKRGLDSSDMESLAVMYDLLQTCFTELAWVEFEATATAHRADDEELLAVVGKAIAVISARPTMSPSASAAGPSTTSGNSTESSSSEPAEDSFEARKRALGLVPVMEAMGVQSLTG